MAGEDSNQASAATRRLPITTRRQRDRPIALAGLPRQSRAVRVLNKDQLVERLEVALAVHEPLVTGLPIRPTVPIVPKAEVAPAAVLLVGHALCELVLTACRLPRARRWSAPTAARLR